jgi:hypothetical protein
MLDKYGDFKFARLFVESAKRYREQGLNDAQPTFSDEFVT